MSYFPFESLPPQKASSTLHQLPPTSSINHPVESSEHCLHLTMSMDPPSHDAHSGKKPDRASLGTVIEPYSLDRSLRDQHRASQASTKPRLESVPRPHLDILEEDSRQVEYNKLRQLQRTPRSSPAELANQERTTRSSAHHDPTRSSFPSPRITTHMAENDNENEDFDPPLSRPTRKSQNPRSPKATEYFPRPVRGNPKSSYPQRPYVEVGPHRHPSPPLPATIQVHPRNRQDITVHMSLDIRDDLEGYLEDLSRASRLGHFGAEIDQLRDQIRHFFQNRYVLVQYGQVLVDGMRFSELANLAQQFPPTKSSTPVELNWNLLLTRAQYLSELFFLGELTNDNMWSAANTLLLQSWPNLDSTEVRIRITLYGQENPELTRYKSF